MMKNISGGKNRAGFITLLVAAMAVIAGSCSLATMSGGDYEIYADVVAASGGACSGGDYEIESAGGQSFVKNIFGGIYNLFAGFIPSGVTEPTVTIISALEATDGSGYVVVSSQYADDDGNKMKAQVQWSTSEGGTYLACLIVPDSAEAAYQDTGGEPSVGTGEYQIGAESGRQIVTVYGTNTVNFAWDTKSSTGFPEDADGTYYIKITGSNGDTLSLATSDLTVDNKAPTDLGSFSVAEATNDTVKLSWTRAYDSHWTSASAVSGYEIWYGTNRTDVESRSGTAEKWDSVEDPAMQEIVTVTTTVTDLTPETVYYFKIWAVDDYGNESTVDVISTEPGIDSDGDGLSNYDEINFYFTDPYNPDTDGDHYYDGVEVKSGSNPLDPASVPQTETVVANYGSNSVSLISPTGGLIRHVEVGEKPLGVAMTPNGMKAYITNYGANTVSVVDIGSGVVTRTIAVGAGPCGACVDNDGNKAYITNSIDDSVSVMDCGRDEVEATIAVGREPRAMLLTADEKYAYVVNTSGDDVSVVDLNESKETSRIGVGSQPLRIAAPENASYAYVTNSFNDTVSVINLNTVEVEKSIPVGRAPVGITVSQDGSVMYVVSNALNKVSAINTVSGAVEAEWTVGGHPWDISRTEDGRYLMVTNRADNSVTVIDLTTGGITSNITVGDDPRGISAQVNAYIIDVTPTPVPTVTPKPGADYPITAELWTDKTTYGCGDSQVLYYKLTLNVKPWRLKDKAADIYVAVRTSSGRFYFYSGKKFHKHAEPIARFPKVVPAEEGIVGIFSAHGRAGESRDGVAINFKALPCLPYGEYTWYAVIVPAKAKVYRSYDNGYSNLTATTFSYDP
jgi:YVTN family beta-propeller protein